MTLPARREKAKGWLRYRPASSWEGIVASGHPWAPHRPVDACRGLASHRVAKRHVNDEGPGVAPPEAEVRELAARIAELGSGTETRAYRITSGTEWLMRRAMGNTELRTQLFRFVDALPAMADDDDLYRHVEEYFGSDVVPGSFARGQIAGPGGSPAAASSSPGVARREVARMATQFIVATDAPEHRGAARDALAARAAPPRSTCSGSTPIRMPRPTATPRASPTSSRC